MVSWAAAGALFAGGSLLVWFVVARANAVLATWQPGPIPADFARRSKSSGSSGTRSRDSEAAKLRFSGESCRLLTRDREIAGASGRTGTLRGPRVLVLKMERDAHLSLRPIYRVLYELPIL
jgi:hypothetical protein